VLPARLCVFGKRSQSRKGLRREFRGDSLWREGADVSPRTVVKPASVKQEPEREAFAHV